MQKVSDAYRQEMTKPVLGAAKLAVTLSVVDEDAAPGAADKSEDQAYWSSVESALTQDGAQKRSYATFEPGRWKADGTLRIADEPGGALLTEGYVSEAMSGADGRFAAPPVLALEFETPVSVPALSFRFDQVAEEWCTALTVTAWKGDEQLVQRQVLPKAVEHQETVQIDRFDRLEIRFEATSQPFRRARLTRLMFGMELVFGQAELTEAAQTMEVDPIGRRLPTGEFSFSAVNVNLLTGSQNGLYDPDNPQGIWKYFEQRNPITVRYGQQLTGGMHWGDAVALEWGDLVSSGWRELYQGGFVEWMPGGRFYLTGQPTVEGLYAKFSATDALGLLDGTYYKGVWDGAPHSLWELATAVLEDADLPRRRQDEQPWALWEGLKQITTTAPLPAKQHRECLQLIAHAACCLLYADRDGVIRIQPDESAQSGVSIGLSAMLESAPKVEKTASLLRVECPATVYTPAEKESQLHKGTYQVDGRMALHLTWNQAADIRLECEGAQVTSQALYAAAADLVLEGSGPATLIVSGKKLETSCQNAVAPVPDADENGTAETLDNPLITELDRALAVAAWVREHLLRRSTYTCATRGNPELDPADRVLLDTQWEPAAPAQVLKNQLTYTGGGLKGEMILKRGNEA